MTPSKRRFSTQPTPQPKISKSARTSLNESMRDDLILTPMLETMLPAWDGTINPDVAENLAKLMSTPQRNRSRSFSASQAGNCLRRQELAFLGIPGIGVPSRQLSMIFANGTWTHMRWQATLMTLGLLDGIEVLVRKPKWRARCSLDGVGTAKEGRFEGREFGFELKGRNDYAFNVQAAKGVDDKTRKQVDFEFLLTGLDLFVILNENKNNQGIKEWVVIRDEARVDAAAQELEELNTSIDLGILHPMLPLCKQMKGPDWDNCPFGSPGGPCMAAGTWPDMNGDDDD